MWAKDFLTKQGTYLCAFASWNSVTNTATVGNTKVRCCATTDNEGRDCYIPHNNIDLVWNESTRLYFDENGIILSWEQQTMNKVREECITIVDNIPSEIGMMRQAIRQIVDDNEEDDGLFANCCYRIKDYLKVSKFRQQYPKCVESMEKLQNEMKLKHNVTTRLARFQNSPFFRMPFQFIHKKALPYMDYLYLNNQKVYVQYYNSKDLKFLLQRYHKCIKQRVLKQHADTIKKIYHLAEGVIYRIMNNEFVELKEHEIATAICHVNDKNGFTTCINSSLDRNSILGRFYRDCLIKEMLFKYSKYKNANIHSIGARYIYRHEFVSYSWKSNDYRRETHEIESPSEITKKKSVSLGKFCNYCLIRKYSECNGRYIYFNMVRCSGCRSVVYCSRKCQKKDWLKHKKQCLTSFEPAFKEKSKFF